VPDAGPRPRTNKHEGHQQMYGRMATKMLLSCAITQRGTPKAVFCAKHVWIESDCAGLGFSQLT
jgi:hypothetical protein